MLYNFLYASMKDFSISICLITFLVKYNHLIKSKSNLSCNRKSLSAWKDMLRTWSLNTLWHQRESWGFHTRWEHYFIIIIGPKIRATKFCYFSVFLFFIIYETYRYQNKLPLDLSSFLKSLQLCCYLWNWNLWLQKSQKSHYFEHITWSEFYFIFTTWNLPP